MYKYPLQITHNFTSRGSTVWTNRIVTINRKSIYLQKWFDKNVIFVTDLMDKDDNL